MQSQKRVTVYKLNDKGELERAQLTIGLSDGENAQIIRGAEEGDVFVVRADRGRQGRGDSPEPGREQTWRTSSRSSPAAT